MKVMVDERSVKLIDNFLSFEKMRVEIVSQCNDILKNIFIVHDALSIKHILFT